MFGKKKKNLKKREVGKIIINRDGAVDITGDFPRDEIINMLRKELIYQQKIEELDIEKKIKKSLKETKPK